LWRRAAVLGLAIAIDRVAAEPPPSLHPVVWIGRWISMVRRILPSAWRHDRSGGVVLMLTTVGVVWGCARMLMHETRHRSAPLAVIADAVLLKPLFAVRALREHGAAVAVALDADDLAGARVAVARIVSRDVQALGVHGIASAAIESLAENASDSAVGAWLAYAVGGLPAAAAYRAVNTLDARVGYRQEGAFGAPSARLDDALNVLPARMTAVVIAAASARPLLALRGAWRDHGVTPSPNAGWPMAAAAHALDVRLEKPGHHVLHASGRQPSRTDVRAALALTDRALLFGAVAIVGILLGVGGRRR
jgi:adenosylcobinamide-phosphate synthase